MLYHSSPKDAISSPVRTGAMMNSAVLERVKRSGASKRALDEGSDIDKKRSRLSHTATEESNITSPKYIDDHPVPGMYPDTIQSFAAGIKGDVFELFTSIHKSFKVLLPSVAPDDQSARREADDNILKELEVNVVASNSATISAVQTKFTVDEKIARQNQIDNAVRMRSRDPSGLLRQDPSALLAASAKSSNAGKKESSQPAPKVKEGGKVQLSKLSSNPSIKAFDCTNNCLLIIGNKRMIYVSRNSEDPADTIANVVWWQGLNDIDGATMSYVSSGQLCDSSSLEFSVRGGRTLTTSFPSAISCTQVLRIIQSKRGGANDITVNGNQSSSSSISSNEGVPATATPAESAASLREFDTVTSDDTGALAAKSSVVFVETKLSLTRTQQTPGKSLVGAAATAVKKAVEAVIRSVSPKRPIGRGGKGASEPPVALKKYQLLLKAGVPEAAVKAKMRSEGVTDAEQQHVLFGAGPPASTPTAAVSPKIEATPAELGKYKGMLAAGVPLPAVMQRMSLDKISADMQQLFASAHGGLGGLAGGKTIMANARKENESGAAAPPAEVPAALMKFKLMLKAGVPEQAVRAKMSAEGVPEQQQQLLLGGASSTPASTPTAAINSTGQVKLLNLHWEPVPVDHKRGSIFSDMDACKGVGDTPSAFSQLASLFSRKDSAAASSSKQKEQSASKKAKTVDLKVIDIGRSTNICITLASLRSRGLNIDKVAAAVAAMDTSVLGMEELCKVGEIAPSEAEVRALGALSGVACPELHESELCLQRLGAVAGLRARLQSMRFLLGFACSCDNVLKKVSVLREAAGRVLLSEGLKTVFKCVLDIGNLLNEGTWKGNAKAFKISSLQRLGQTRSTDGKSTLLDYLVELLGSRVRDGDECYAAALAIDTELGNCSSARMVSIIELDKEVVVLRKELQVANALLGGESQDEKAAATASSAANTAQLQLAEQRVAQAEHAVEECRAKCVEMAVFVGEDAGQSQQVLQLLADFVVGFAASKARAASKAKAEEKRVAAEKKATKRL